ncbi:MAG: TRL domain-containing protein [Candidatus Sumerlaeia bacterium]|nr:TRL domain-containing protein [Candidatus Sumerlaeia bacterium]
MNAILRRSAGLVAILAAGILSGCAIFPQGPVLPYAGTGYNNTSFPVDIDFVDGGSIGATSGTTKSESVVFGLIAWGDATTHTAAANGGLSTVDHVDATYFNVLGLYTKYETVAYGSR